MCSSVSGPKTLKNVSAIGHIQFQWKIAEHFRNRIKKIWSVVQNRSYWKKYFERKIPRHIFVVYVLIYPLSKFRGNRKSSLLVLSFYSVLFKWKNWFEKKALNMSIRRVSFTSRQNLKPPFLCQYLIFFNDFFFTLEISFGSLPLPKNRNFKKIVDLKVYCSASQQDVLECESVWLGDIHLRVEVPVKLI